MFKNACALFDLQVVAGCGNEGGSSVTERSPHISKAGVSVHLLTCGAFKAKSGGGVKAKTSAEGEDVLAQERWRISVQAGRAGSQRHAHTTPLNNGWSEAAAGPPGDIIAASLVQLRQVGGGGEAGGGGLVQYSVTERERGSGRNLPADGTRGGTVRNHGSSLEEALRPRSPAPRRLRARQRK